MRIRARVLIHVIMENNHETHFCRCDWFLLALDAQSFAADGNAARGQRVFGACAACHSLQPDQNMTGPSLADLWGRKAGSLPSFNRYSSALKLANVAWNDKTPDQWIEDPQHLVPGNEMTFAGIKDDRQRADLLAFLKQSTKPGASVAQQGGRLEKRTSCG
jgi:cytochrome c